MFISGTQNIDFYSNIKLTFFIATTPIILFSGCFIQVSITSAGAKGNKEERCVSGKGQNIRSEFLHYLAEGKKNFQQLIYEFSSRLSLQNCSHLRCDVKYRNKKLTLKGRVEV